MNYGDKYRDGRGVIKRAKDRLKGLLITCDDQGHPSVGCFDGYKFAPASYGDEGKP